MAASYVDAHGATAAHDHVDVVAPDGIANGDILVATCHTRKTSGTPTIGWPAGFTELCVRARAGWTNHDYGIAWKLAASESGDYTFTSDAATTIEAIISVWRGCSATPIGNYSNTDYITNDTIIRGATITTSAVGMVLFCGYLNRSSADNIVPEAGYTEAVEAGQAAATYHYIEHSYLLGVAANTATGNIDANSTNSNAVKHAFLVELKDYVAPAAKPYCYMINSRHMRS